MRQAELFLNGEGDAWHERNRDKPRLPDPVLDAMDACLLTPKFILEIGCGNGWRLNAIEARAGYGPGAPRLVRGFDASAKAIKEGIIDGIYQGEALHSLGAQKDASFDLIVFGFCLYLVDREDLMMIAAHTDRVLKDGGHIIIHDFLDLPPCRIAYKHKEGLWAYHMTNPNLWLGNPAYQIIYRRRGTRDNEDEVSVLKKNMADAFPERKT